jgi:hypothetical protein
MPNPQSQVPPRPVTRSPPERYFSGGAVRAVLLWKQEHPVNTRTPLALTVLSALSMQLTACEVVEGVFKAGFWVGVFGVFAVAVLVFLALSLVRR